ncbi:hypothetical protein [Vibrio harveyi]|uniref:hypothetical protein n=2 Tax=Vibrio TaxID=662 RepID=UPI000517E12F|nr:hypothetical protein [Vibrio harveyi]
MASVIARGAQRRNELSKARTPVDKEARSKKQEARSKKQEARSKKQEARSKKQEARNFTNPRKTRNQKLINLPIIFRIPHFAKATPSKARTEQNQGNSAL